MTIVLIILAFFVGLALGVFQTKTIYEKSFERFRDEIHAQYIMLIKKHEATESYNKLKENNALHYHIEIPNLNQYLR